MKSRTDARSAQASCRKCPAATQKKGNEADPHQAPERAETVITLHELTGHRVEIAIDTEFVGTHTLTIQTACRLDRDTVAVKVYRDEAVRHPPKGFDLAQYFPRGPEGYGRFFKHLEWLPTGMIQPWLSPARYMADLLGLERVDFLSRREGEELLAGFDQSRGPKNGTWDAGKRRWRIPKLEIAIVGHFLPADFNRMFGKTFLRDLLETSKVKFSDHEPLGLVESRRFAGTAPVVEFIRSGSGDLYAVTLKTEDTMLPFGPASLDDHGRTFLGLGKLDGLTDSDKADMPRTFQKKTHLAYGYAVRDVVNTLLVFEEMQRQDRQLYHDFGIDCEDLPPMRSTIGGRVADFLRRMTRKALGVGSRQLARKRDLRFLMKQGGGTLFQHGCLPSVFGAQTATIQGGLNFSRSSTVFFHDAPGMLRDVDMANCYNSAMAKMNVYWGRPIIYEPGRRTLSLCEAVQWVSEHADNDAWMLRVTGNVHTIPNMLIPSTTEAITSENYREKMQERLLADAFDEMESLPELGGGRLYSQKIDAGVVTWATWMMIQAMPDAARHAYESLSADSIVFYPRKLAAANAAEYDRLVEQHKTDQLPWATVVNMKKLEITRTIHIDASYVTVRFPIGRLAAKIARRRKQAKKKHGRKSGQDTAIKLLANNMYGVLGCRYYDTQNAVAANVITARARAEAFALMLALNGIQLITDGCTYRADQVPACSFEECLRIQPDYPLRRAEAESGIPFLDPATIPTESGAFTKWCRQHVKRFFGVSGVEYDQLFGTHELEHRPTAETGSIAFDGLACDGSANYVQCTLSPDGSWRPEDFKARSYGRKSKAAIAPWLVRTYSEDQLRDLAPITEEDSLLKLDAALQKIRAAMNEGLGLVCFPLGLPETRVHNYHAIKPSAWIFKSPKQRATFLKQIEKFQEEHDCGLEIISLRRSYRGRSKCSLRGLAEVLYECIREDVRDITKRFNLCRSFDALEEIVHPRQLELQQRRKSARERLRNAMDFTRVAPGRFPTGLVVTKSDVHLLEPH